MHVEEAIEGLLATLSDPRRDVEELTDEATPYASALIQAPPADWPRILSRLDRGISLDCPLRAGIVANVAGALVEQGADPGPIVMPLLTRLQRVLPVAQEFLDACAGELEHEPRPADLPADEEWDPLTDGEAFAAVEARLANILTEPHMAWLGLEVLHAPVVAVLSTSPELRQRAQPLLPAVHELAGHHGGAQWIEKLLLVLDREPVLVLEPATGRGLVGTLSGVADNFQLHMLLMDTLPAPGLVNWLLGGRLPRDQAALARGIGPQQLDAPVTGRWNLYNWPALDAAGNLPPAGDFGSSALWIWNEGIPADIAPFDGRRVILLGPPAYPRSWNACRLFGNLPADLAVERMLTPAEVHEWIGRLAKAPRPATSAD